MDSKIMIGIMILLILLNNFIYVRAKVNHSSDILRIELDWNRERSLRNQKYIEEAHADLIKRDIKAIMEGQKEIKENEN